MLFAADSASSAAAAATETVWHLSQADVDNLFTMIAGFLTVQWFTLLAQFIAIGVLLVIVFVIAVRRV